MAIDFEYNFDKAQAWKCVSYISDFLKANGYQVTEKNIIFVGYLLYETSRLECFGIEYYELMNTIPRQIAENVSTDFSRVWQEIMRYADCFPKRVFREVVLKNFPTSQRHAEGSTPASVCRLAGRILNIHKGDTVADICCGQGSFMSHVMEQFRNVDFYGIDLSADNVLISCVRYHVLQMDEAFELYEEFVRKHDNRWDLSRNIRMPIYQGDVFLEFADCNEKRPRFDKIFANYPWNLRLRNQFGFQRYIEYSELYDDVRGKCSSDWFFNDILVKSLKPDGRAVAIMSLGSGWNKTDEKARKFFVDNGYVEAVIRLPEKLFGHTSLAANLIVLSRNNQGVRFIDASNEFEEGRRYNEISDENIERILNMLGFDCEDSRHVSYDEIVMNEFVLSPERYLRPHEDVKNGMRLEDVLKAIKRSVPLTAAQLDKFVATEETRFKFVRQSDIQHGDISDDLPSLKSFEKSWDKYLLKNNDLIMLKTIQPMKTAIIHLEDGEKVLPVGNMYVLELDETKINPYYLKAFFESESGRNVLSKANTGTNVQIISVDVLKNLVIPVPDMKVQDRIAQAYIAALDEVRIAKLRLARALDKLNSAFEEGKEEF